MAGGTQVPVFVGRAGEHVVIRPEGACTVAICETVRCGLAQFLAGGTSDLDFDLSLAEWLDSTFAGYLVSLVTRDRQCGVNVHLIAPSAPAVKSLEQMHILSLFDVRDRLPAEPVRWERLPPVDPDKAAMAARLLDAHECLIEADERNGPVFTPVVKMFRDQQKKKT